MHQERTVKIKVQIPMSLKVKLGAAKAQGITAAGLIRHLLTQHFNQPQTGRKDGHA